jgi:hypothetical protein
LEAWVTGPDLQWLLFLAAAAGLASCQQPDSEYRVAADDSGRELEAAIDHRVSRGVGEMVRFRVGSTDFIAPDEVIGFQVAYQGQSVDFVTLGIFLPDPVDYPVSESEDREDQVLIALEYRAELPIIMPETLDEANVEFDRVFPDRLFTMSANDQLGLVEIKYLDERDYVAYRRSDDYLRPNDGLFTVAVCLSPSSPTLCDVHGFIEPDTSVKYRFYPSRLPDWPTIDKAVFNYIDDIRQPFASVDD